MYGWKRFKLSIAGNKSESEPRLTRDADSELRAVLATCAQTGKLTKPYSPMVIAESS